jgi:hypothetical protein
LSLAFAWLAGCTSFEPLRVPQILEMTREGVPPDTIIARIRESNTVYRLHAHQVAQLSRDGVNQKVLDYMQQTYLDAVRRDQSLADWDNYALGQDGFFYGGDPVGWTPGWQ